MLFRDRIHAAAAGRSALARFAAQYSGQLAFWSGIDHIKSKWQTNDFLRKQFGSGRGRFLHCRLLVIDWKS